MLFQTKNSQLIECIVYGQPGGGNTSNYLQLLDQPYLRDQFIRSIEAFNSDDIAVSPSGNAVVTPAVFKSAFITLYVNDPDNVNQGRGEFIKQVPLSCLHTLQNSNSDAFERFPYLLSNQVISWDKSYINLGTPTASTSNMSFLFNIGFAFSGSTNN